MFSRGRGFRGFRPRNSTSQALHVATLTVIGMASGYYIFNEPLKNAVLEVKAKERRELAAVGGESRRDSSSPSSSSSSSSSGRSGGDGGRGKEARPGAAEAGGVNGR